MWQAALNFRESLCVVHNRIWSHRTAIVQNIGGSHHLPWRRRKHCRSVLAPPLAVSESRSHHTGPADQVQPSVCFQMSGKISCQHFCTHTFHIEIWVSGFFWKQWHLTSATPTLGPPLAGAKYWPCSWWLCPVPTGYGLAGCSLWHYLWLMYEFELTISAALCDD